ncbi:hypothetical protein D3C71_1412690 [compost metagenome]
MLHHVLQQIHGQHGGRGGAQAKAQRAGFHVRQDLGAAPQFGQFDAYPPRTGQRQFAQGGQRLVLAALQQRPAQFLFQRLDAAAERGLGQVQLIGGTAEGLGFDHGQEVVQLLKIHAARQNYSF